ncbi:MAG: helix-hairpin-helix domain-containing protein [candidate division WOR-3 bacterium]
MNRKEFIIISVLISILLIINILNYAVWQSNKKTYSLIIEEEMRQISINIASEEQLAMLPGIGPALAQRIVEFREKNGEFKKIEDIKKVKGVGEKLFEKIKSYIKL